MILAFILGFLLGAFLPLLQNLLRFLEHALALRASKNALERVSNEVGLK